MNVFLLGDEKSFTKRLNKLNWVQQLLPHGDIVRWNNFTLLTKLGLPVLAAIRSVAATDTLPEGNPEFSDTCVRVAVPLLPASPYTTPHRSLWPALVTCLEISRHLREGSRELVPLPEQGACRENPAPCESLEQSRRAGEPCPQAPTLSSAQTPPVFAPLLLPARRRVEEPAPFSPWAAWGWGC